MRIAGYGRVSTAREAQLDSLDHQREFFSQYAAANGLELYRVYADEGISGKQMKNRREFLRMLEDARLRLFDMVVVKDVSRFARNTVDLLTAVRELKAAGIEVQFLSHNQTVLGNSEFVLTVFGALAQEESASLSKRVKFGKKINAQKGRVPNSVYGYRQIDTFHLEIVEKEAQVVRWIYRKYLEEGWGTRRVAAELGARGIPSRSGGPWRATTVRRLLQNPLYGGVLETNKTETVDFLTGKRRETPADERFRLERPEWRIVPERQWKAAQETLKRRADLYGAGNRYSARHLFSSLIRCGECGYSYCRRSRTSQRSGRIYFWVCSGRKNFTAEFCGNGHVLEEKKLTEALETCLKSVIADREDFVRQVLGRADRLLGEAGREGAAQAAKRLEALERKKRRCREMYAEGLTSLEELKESLAAAAREEEELRRSVPAGEEDRSRRWKETYGSLEALLDLSVWTNADLRKAVDGLTVNAAGEIFVRFREFTRRLL